jgi:hypothetical protein
MRDILGTLRGSDTPEADRQRFLSTHLLLWLLAASDGHAKNFSLVLETRGRYTLRLPPVVTGWTQWTDFSSGYGARGHESAEPVRFQRVLVCRSAAQRFAIRSQTIPSGMRVECDRRQSTDLST